MSVNYPIELNNKLIVNSIQVFFLVVISLCLFESSRRVYIRWMAQVPGCQNVQQTMSSSFLAEQACPNILTPSFPRIHANAKRNSRESLFPSILTLLTHEYFFRLSHQGDAESPQKMFPKHSLGKKKKKESSQRHRPVDIAFVSVVVLCLFPSNSPVSHLVAGCLQLRPLGLSRQVGKRKNSNY